VRAERFHVREREEHHNVLGSAAVGARVLVVVETFPKTPYFNQIIFVNQHVDVHKVGVAVTPVAVNYRTQFLCNYLEAEARGVDPDQGEQPRLGTAEGEGAQDRVERWDFVVGKHLV